MSLKGNQALLLFLGSNVTYLLLSLGVFQCVFVCIEGGEFRMHGMVKNACMVVYIGGMYLATWKGVVKNVEDTRQVIW